LIFLPLAAAQRPGVDTAGKKLLYRELKIKNIEVEK